VIDKKTKDAIRQELEALDQAKSEIHEAGEGERMEAVVELLRLDERRSHLLGKLAEQGSTNQRKWVEAELRARKDRILAVEKKWVDILQRKLADDDLEEEIAGGIAAMAGQQVH
jgi:hypothetical protein